MGGNGGQARQFAALWVLDTALPPLYRWGKKMKTSIRTLLPLVALIVGCDERTKVVATGSEAFTFNGVEIELPNSGKGHYGIGPKQLDYRWDSKALKIRDLGDKTVSVTTPVVSDQLVDKSVIIQIDPEGNITTRTPKHTDENQKPQQSATSNGG